MKTFRKIYDNIECILCVTMLTLMLVGLTYNTISRYFFHYAVSWMEEICCYCQIWLIYCAVSYAVQRNAHICVDSVRGLYPKKIRPYFMQLGLICWLVFGVIMTVVGTQYTYSIFVKGGRSIALPFFPMWVVYLAIPVGHCLMSIRLVELIVNNIKLIAKGVDPDDYAVEPPKEDIITDEKEEGGEV